MPINPKSGETQDEFVSRCIGEEISSGKEQDQAAAICYSVWRQENMSKLSGQDKIIEKLKFARDFKGINLNAAGLEDACWPGYVAIGTKILDGREVPNCVPEGENMEEGVPHFTEDGELWEGPTHMGPDGRLMTGEVHTEDSEYLYHREELEVLPIIDSTYPGEGPSGSLETKE